jgi:predicted amidohydrolase
MRIWCILTASELEDRPADLIVFPERVCCREIEKAQWFNPHALIAAAIVERGHCRGILHHEGQNRIDYWKIGSDGITQGCKSSPQQPPVYEFGNACVGLLICMDVQDFILAPAVIQGLNTSQAGLKILCIPASMENSSWFSGDMVPGYEGIHVVLCNQNMHAIRCKNFVTDTHGLKIVEQDQDEPIHVELSCE